jgi:hypothetical protein
MSIGKVVLMVLITFLATATIMPFVLVNVPAAQDETIGVTVVCGIAILVFATLWVVWSRFGGRK